MIIQGVALNGVTVVDAQSIVTTNLVANYDALTGVSGSTFIDSSGNGNNATLFGSVIPTTTTVGGTTVLRLNSAQSQYFGDTTGYGTILDNAFTFDVWCYPLSASTAGTLIGEWSGSSFNTGWTDAQMGFTTTQINCGVYNTGYATAQNGWSANTWYNIVMTYNGSTTPQLKTYVNTVAGGTTTGVKSNPGSTYLSMGKYDNSGTYLGGVANYFNGYIGSWKIYNAALTPTQISQNFNALRGRYGV